MLPQHQGQVDDVGIPTSNSQRGMLYGQSGGLSMISKTPAVTLRNAVVKLPAREIKWTAVDEIKLNSIDYLLRQTREFNNCVHSITGNREVESSHDDIGGHMRPVFKYAHFIPKVHPPQGLAEVGMQEVSNFLSCYNMAALGDSSKPIDEQLNLPSCAQRRAKNGVLWIVVMEMEFVEIILRHFDVHPIFASYFHDSRPHSSFLESDCGFFFSICCCSLQRNDQQCKLVKLYMYVTSGLCIIFERDLFPNIASGDSALFLTTNPEFVSNNLLTRLQLSGPLYAQRGSSFLFYELLTEAIRMQSSLFQFCSVTIFYFKNLIRMNQEDLFDGNIDRKVRVIESCLVLLEKNAKGSLSAVQQLSSGHRMVLSKGKTSLTGSWACHYFSIDCDNLPCLDALVDSYSYINTMVNSDITEIRAVHADMASISNIRQSKTSITLSLVATVFLPMTFLTGVFGMNFQFTGGNGTYTIPIVNDPYGPLYFLYMCLGLSGFAMLYFIANGWVNLQHSFESFVDWVRDNFCCCFRYHKSASRHHHRDTGSLSISDVASVTSNSRFVAYSRDSSFAAPSSKELLEAHEEENRRSMRASIMRSRFGNVAPAVPGSAGAGPVGVGGPPVLIDHRTYRY